MAKPHFKHYFSTRRLKIRDGRTEKHPFHRAFRILKKLGALKATRPGKKS